MSFLHLPSILGGVLIGISAAIFLFGAGRIAGVSGILGGLVERAHDGDVRLAFLAGLFVVGVVAAFLAPSSIPARPAAFPLVVLSGLLVGFGTRLGNGCTSGHGVCGSARFSPRSLTATCVFVGIGMLTVYVMRALWSQA